MCFKELRKTIELKLEQKMRGGPGQLRKAFKLFDKDSSGFVTDTEFVHLMRAWGVEISKEQAAEFIATMDKDGNGTLDYNEFIQEMLSHTHGAHAGTSMLRKPSTQGPADPHATPTVTSMLRKPSTAVEHKKKPEQLKNLGGVVGGGAGGPALDPTVLATEASTKKAWQTTG
jgi:hypothetical protein